METGKTTDCLVLGLGNILWTDEGFGVRALERFNAKYEVSGGTVELIDGGNLGMFLLEPICRARRALIFETCNFGGQPAELRLLEGSGLKLWRASKLSTHQRLMNEVWDAAVIQDEEPEETAVVALQPQAISDEGGSLTPQARAQIEVAADLAAQVLRGWGLRIAARRGAAPRLSPAECLDMPQYEKAFH